MYPNPGDAWILCLPVNATVFGGSSAGSGISCSLCLICCGSSGGVSIVSEYCKLQQVNLLLFLLWMHVLKTRTWDITAPPRRPRLGSARRLFWQVNRDDNNPPDHTMVLIRVVSMQGCFGTHYNPGPNKNLITFTENTAGFPATNTENVQQKMYFHRKMTQN